MMITSTCTEREPKTKNDVPSLIARLYGYINLYGQKVLGRYWLPRYFGAIYPGIIAHFKQDILADFQAETVQNGYATSVFFAQSGIRAFALKHNSMCTLRMGKQVILYQVNNCPLVDDDSLSPTTLDIKPIFGDFFMGTYMNSDPIRKIKRAPILKIMSNPKALTGFIPTIEIRAREFLNKCQDKSFDLNDFAMKMVLYVDSYLPGVLDFADKPLTDYIDTQDYDPIMKHSLELAAKILTGEITDITKETNVVIVFVKKIIGDNFAAIKAAPDTNLIKQQFKIYDIPFEKETIDDLPDYFLKELAAIIIPLYETTNVSLLWLLSYIESDPDIKNKVIEAAKNPIDINKPSYIDFVVMETIRLAGGNPTSFYREVVSPRTISINGANIYLPKGMQLWLDRRNANQDPHTFSCPEKFDVGNIESILKNDKETIFSIFGHKRYEVNSFAAVNTIGNPRKCPGRYFSVFLQSMLIREIYNAYDVSCHGLSLGLKRHSVFPKPDKSATIMIKKKQ